MAEHLPFSPFRFRVVFHSGNQADAKLFCAGSFSEVSGLEITMTPKGIKEGGRNFGDIQRAGPSTFGTLVLKRGVTPVDHLWVWFEAVANQGNYGHRMNGIIEVWDRNFDVDDNGQKSGNATPRLRWRVTNALPVKFKGPDLSATSGDVAVEEIHLVHEGLILERP